MEYFLVKPDSRVRGALPSGNFECYLDSMIQVTELPWEAYYLDYVPASRMLVSDDICKVLKAYEPSVLWKPFVLADPKRGRQICYQQAIEPPVSDCIHGETEYTLAGKVKNLVLERSKINFYYFYVITKLETFFIVNLDVAESLLRRKVCGLCLERLKWVD